MADMSGYCNNFLQQFKESFGFGCLFISSHVQLTKYIRCLRDVCQCNMLFFFPSKLLLFLKFVNEENCSQF